MSNYTNCIETSRYNMRQVWRYSTDDEIRDSIGRLQRLIGSVTCPHCREENSKAFYTDGIKLWPLNIIAMNEMLAERELDRQRKMGAKQ